MDLTLLDTLKERDQAVRDGWHTGLDALAAGMLGHEDAREGLNKWREVNTEYNKRSLPKQRRSRRRKDLKRTYD